VTSILHVARPPRALADFGLFLSFIVFALCIVFPDGALAFADSGAAQQLGDKAETALGFIKTAVYFILVVAVIGSGVMAAFGRLSWMTVGTVLAGAVIAGIGAEVVDALYGSQGGA